MGDDMRDPVHKNLGWMIEVHFFSAEQLWPRLRRTDSLWRAGNAVPCLFRGQANADWGLVPAAWRTPRPPLVRRMQRKLVAHGPVPRVSQLRLSPAVAKRTKKCMLQAATEHELVWRFTELADDTGLPVPGHGSLVSGTDLLGEWKDSGYAFPSPVTLHRGANEMTALAQHHGIPTRLLDWTKRPDLAAFFACEENVARTARGASGRRLAIWVLDIDAVLRKHTILGLFTCPRSNNHYLHAQDGVFLWLPDADSRFVSNEHWPSFDDLIRAAHPGGTDEPWLIKLTLPVSEAPALQRLLHLERISRAHLMPGYSSVADTVRLEWTKGLQP